MSRVPVHPGRPCISVKISKQTILFKVLKYLHFPLISAFSMAYFILLSICSRERKVSGITACGNRMRGKPRTSQRNVNFPKIGGLYRIWWVLRFAILLAKVVRIFGRDGGLRVGRAQSAQFFADDIFEVVHTLRLPKRESACLFPWKHLAATIETKSAPPRGLWDAVRYKLSAS